MWDPRNDGALCDQCGLAAVREGTPVPSEMRSGALCYIAGEAPGLEETKVGRPFYGASGQELIRALEGAGIRRDEVSLGNAISCRPPGNDLATHRHWLGKENERREAAKLPPLLDPAVACRQRFYTELHAHHNVIAVGKTAYQAISGSNASIMAIRGGPAVLYPHPDRWMPVMHPEAPHAGLKVMPTIHSAFVMRARAWTSVFRGDIARAIRWFTGRLGWVEPKTTMRPDVATLRRWLAAPHEFVAFDLETDGLEPLTCNIRCIGLATPDEAMMVPILSIDGKTTFYDDVELAEVRCVLASFFLGPTVKIAHNFYYDSQVLKARWGVVPTPYRDTILLHRSVDTELPHNLGLVASIYTEIPGAWKSEHTATQARSDEDLHVYNVIDAVLTARIVAPLVRAVEMRQQAEVVKIDHRVQALCASMHENGMLVDGARRNEWDTKLAADALQQHAACRLTAGLPNLNPGSYPQVRHVLFERFGLAPTAFTPLDEPSTDDDSLRALRLGAKGDALNFINALRKFRRTTKLRGTYVKRLVPVTQAVPWDPFARDEEAEVDAEEAKREGRPTRLETPKGLLLADGRVHPDWNAHGTRTGRLSSKRSNAQNWPKKMRNMVVPAPGNVLVSIDADQLELRIICALAGCESYLEAFRAGKDPHAITSELLYGSAFTHANDADRGRMRDFSKRFVYAISYGSGDDTVHETITSVENDAGDLIYADMSMRETTELRRRWLAGVPQMATWWERQIKGAQQCGYMTEPVFGRRRDFMDEDAHSDILNYEPQASGAAIVMLATLDFLSAVACQYAGPGTGLICHIHDALLVECPEADATRIANTLRECMTRTVNIQGVDMAFSGKPKIGRNWAEV